MATVQFAFPARRSKVRPTSDNRDPEEDKANQVLALVDMRWAAQAMCLTTFPLTESKRGQSLSSALNTQPFSTAPTANQLS